MLNINGSVLKDCVFINNNQRRDTNRNEEKRKMRSVEVNLGVNNLRSTLHNVKDIFYFSKSEVIGNECGPMTKIEHQ